MSYFSMLDMAEEYVSNVWNLFSDSSKKTLKLVLLNNTHKKTSITIKHSVQMKAWYENIIFLLDTIIYSELK